MIEKTVRGGVLGGLPSKALAVIVSLALAASFVPSAALTAFAAQDADAEADADAAATSAAAASADADADDADAAAADDAQANTLVTLSSSGTCGDNLTWTLSDGTLTISGSGEMYDYSSSSFPWYDERASVRTVVIGSSVTGIGNRAFYGCTAITSVTIGRSVTSIGVRAFQGCTGLRSVTFGSSLTTIESSAFEACTGLTSFTIPDTVTTIGDYAFYDCTGLTSLVIGSAVTVIEEYAFCSCTGLTSVTMGAAVTTIGEGAFKECTGLTSIEIGRSVTSIGYRAFYDCTRLASATIGSSVTSIGERAFQNCSSLTSVDLPDSLTTIGDSAFEACSSLTSVEIPDSVSSMGTYVFYECTGMTSAVIGGSFSEIPECSFRACTGLKSVTMGDNVATIGYRAFYGCTGLTSISMGENVSTVGEASFEGCTGLTSVILGDNVSTIGYRAFYGCTGLKSIDIPDCVTTIGERAFQECTGLTSVTRGSSVTTIGDSAFESCTGLTSVSIGSSVTTIGEYAFYNCTGLTSVTIGSAVTTICESAFRNCTALKSVTMGKSVTVIEYRAFYDCSALRYVYYTGTEEGWDNISIDDGNDPLLRATIYYLGSSGSSLYASGVTFTELAGSTRYVTMNAIVSEAYDGKTSKYAVLATGSSFPDALAAASLAGALDAPVVLVNAKDVQSAINLLESLEVECVYIVGGTSAVSSSVASQISSATGAVIERVSGANRYATALEIASVVQDLAGAAGSDTCIVASGANFPDALSASPYSYWSESPIFLASADGTLAEGTLESIEAGGYMRVVVMGGTSAVSTAAVQQLEAAGLEVERLGGENRYDTSALMAEWSVDEGMSYDSSAIATGANFPDALAGATVCGRSGSVMLLVSDTRTQAVDLLADADGVSEIYFLGGTSAVSAKTRAYVLSLLGV